MYSKSALAQYQKINAQTGVVDADPHRLIQLLLEGAIDRMRRALSEFTIEGVNTTIPFHHKVLDHEAFRYGDVETNFIAKHIAGTE